jgi:hypothetical protein
MTGKLADPVFQRQRAGHSADALIRTLVRRAPELTDEQIQALRPILASTDGGA